MKIPPPSFFEIFKKTPGAIGVAESIAIYNLALEAPEGVRIDLGSHCAKAAMSAASAFDNGKIYLVDPCYDLNNEEAWAHSVQGTAKNMPWHYFNEKDILDRIKRSISEVSNTRVGAVLIGDYSENVILGFNRYSWAFIDSDSHQDGMALREAKMLEDRMVAGGIIALHDFGNQFSDPKLAHQYLIDTGNFENIPIDWAQIFDYVRENNSENGNNSWHESGSNEFPCYVGAVRRK
jgi:hypothetical protein